MGRTDADSIVARRQAARDRIVSECKDMVRLRYELNRREIEWWDESEWIPFAHNAMESSGIMIARTKWVHDGETVSVIWGYHTTADGGYGMTACWPMLLECWYRPLDKEPRAMTVEEILEVCA